MAAHLSVCALNLVSLLFLVRSPHSFMDLIHSFTFILLFIPFGNENAPLAELQQEGLPLKHSISDRRNPKHDRKPQIRLQFPRRTHNHEAAQIHYSQFCKQRGAHIYALVIGITVSWLTNFGF